MAPKGVMKSLTKDHPVKVYGTLLTLGTALLAAATAALSTQEYWAAAGLGLAGAGLLFVREFI